ncbi:phage virion morphogenesis protein [Serratia symbiotica]|uniref:phage virion morphogenesis protein n=1 Tax=Serratia symbiotica TaxID=138074 RepID=UPI001EEEA0C7|nr:phage virion morphogenesis protein [Serratia symbiotica]
MVELFIDVPDTLRRALERMVRSLENRQPLMQAISEDMLSAVMENFEQEGRPKWLPVQRAGKILQNTRRLMSSIDSDADNNMAVVGTNVVYARIHNEGGTTRPHVIRPRYKQALAFNGRWSKRSITTGSCYPERRFLS